MKKDIKRMAQFVWDNADAIAKFLTQSGNYRSAQFQLDLFDPMKPSDLRTTFAIYDDQSTHLYLYDNDITADEFAKICEKMNKETGVIPPSPKPPVEVREKLETK